MRNRGVELFILPEVVTYFLFCVFIYCLVQDQLDCNDVDLAALLYRDGVSDLSTSSRLIECYKKVVELKRNQGEYDQFYIHVLT